MNVLPGILDRVPRGGMGFQKSNVSMVGPSIPANAVARVCALATSRTKPNLRRCLRLDTRFLRGSLDHHALPAGPHQGKTRFQHPISRQNSKRHRADRGCHQHYEIYRIRHCSRFASLVLKSGIPLLACFTAAGKAPLMPECTLRIFAEVAHNIPLIPIDKGDTPAKAGATFV